MILLVWSSEKAPECARAIEQAFQNPVRVVPHLDAAVEELRKIPFLAVILDQHLWDGFPPRVDLLLQHLGDAVPVIVNFAISTTERVVRELKEALDRWTRITQLARRGASAILMSELKDELTAWFLSCGIALHEPVLNATAAEQLKRIEGIAKRMRQKLSEPGVLAGAAHA